MEKDHPKTVMIILFIASFILAAWNIWFFFAQISLFECSIHAEVAEKPKKIVPSFSGPGRVRHHKQHIILASFPLQMEKKIYQGQKGIFFPSSNMGNLLEGITAIVTHKTAHLKDSNLSVRLKTIESVHSPMQLKSKTTGLIKLEITRVSPFELMLMKLSKN
jgi:hypothetical protein